jgi:hypothetical protein
MLDYIDTFIELPFLYHKWLSFDRVGENSVSIREWMRVVQILGAGQIPKPRGQPVGSSIVQKRKVLGGIINGYHRAPVRTSTYVN